MTALPPTVPDPQTTRPSTAVMAVAHTESFLNQLPAKVFAFALFVVFAHLAWVEAKSAEPSNFRLGLMVIPAVLFAAMLTTDLMTNTIRSVGGALAPYLPAKFGGKS